MNAILILFKVALLFAFALLAPRTGPCSARLTIADVGRDWRQIDSQYWKSVAARPKAPCLFGGRTRSTAFCIGRQRRSGDHFHLTKSSWGDPHYGKEVRYQC